MTARRGYLDRLMMVSDLVAVTAMAAILIVQATGHLPYWHLYVTVVIQGLGASSQWPAYLAAISVMVPKEQYEVDASWPIEWYMASIRTRPTMATRRRARR